MASASCAEVFVDVGDDGHRILDNLFVGGARPSIVLQGTSYNVVAGTGLATVPEPWFANSRVGGMMATWLIRAPM